MRLSDCIVPLNHSMVSVSKSLYDGNSGAVVSSAEREELITDPVCAGLLGSVWDAGVSDPSGTPSSAAMSQYSRRPVADQP